MYRSNKRQRKFRTFVQFTLLISPFLFAIALAIWFVFMRSDKTASTSFTKVGTQVAIVKPSTRDFTNDIFKITLRSSWESLGKKNPVANQVYYEFQDKQQGNDNRWLRVYVDTFPRDFGLNKLLPISVVNNHINPGVISDDCKNFTGAPLNGNRSGGDTWAAKWQGIDFTCDMANPRNYVGTASIEEGVGSTLISTNGVKRKYFFVYIDHNVRPEYQFFTDALKSFQTL